jgi:acyl-CoA synthetase (NDP forming)
MDYKRLLQPESMAVIGVSRHNNRHPANIVYRKNRLRYPLKVFAVNPGGGELHGDRLYKRAEEIPEKVDLAVIAVRADMVPDTLAQCISADMGGAVIISGGFAEVGRTELQERLVTMARDAEFPFVGPNCLGIFPRDAWIPSFCRLKGPYGRRPAMWL